MKPAINYTISQSFLRCKPPTHHSYNTHRLSFVSEHVILYYSYKIDVRDNLNKFKCERTADWTKARFVFHLHGSIFARQAASQTRASFVAE